MRRRAASPTPTPTPTVLGEPVEIPGIGHYVSFTDTEGNRVSLLQPSDR